MLLQEHSLRLLPSRQSLGPVAQKVAVEDEDHGRARRVGDEDGRCPPFMGFIWRGAEMLDADGLPGDDDEEEKNADQGIHCALGGRHKARVGNGQGGRKDAADDKPHGLILFILACNHTGLIQAHKQANRAHEGDHPGDHVHDRHGIAGHHAAAWRDHGRVDHAGVRKEAVLGGRRLDVHEEVGFKSLLRTKSSFLFTRQHTDIIFQSSKRHYATQTDTYGPRLGARTLTAEGTTDVLEARADEAVLLAQELTNLVDSSCRRYAK